MKIRVDLNVPLDIYVSRNEKTKEVTITSVITLKEPVCEVLGEGGIATVESALRLAIEDSMPGFFEGGD